MHKIVKLSAILLIICSFLACNIGKQGKAVVFINKNRVSNSDLDTIEIWCPYNYYCIDWYVSFEQNRPPMIMGSGLTEGNELFGSFRIMNNYMYQNNLNVDSLNRILEKMEVEKPYLIRDYSYLGFDSLPARTKHYLLFTKNKNLYTNKEALVNIAIQH